VRRLLSHNSAYEQGCNNLEVGGGQYTFSPYFTDSKVWYSPKATSGVVVFLGSTLVLPLYGYPPPEWWNPVATATVNCASRCATLTTCNMFFLDEKHNDENLECTFFSVLSGDWLLKGGVTPSMDTPPPNSLVTGEFNYKRDVGPNDDSYDYDANFLYYLERNTFCGPTTPELTCQPCAVGFYLAEGGGCESCPLNTTTSSEGLFGARAVYATSPWDCALSHAQRRPHQVCVHRRLLRGRLRLVRTLPPWHDQARGRGRGVCALPGQYVPLQLLDLHSMPQRHGVSIELDDMHVLCSTGWHNGEL